MDSHPESRYHNWPADGIEMSDLLKYTGLLLNMGLVPKKKKSDFRSTRRPIATPFFGETMTSNMFALIDRMLHISNIEEEIRRGQEGFDPWVKIRLVLDKVNSSATRFYIPSQNVSIDESMIGMKNRCVYIQFMPNKRHARFGIRKFEVCDSNGYVVQVRLYAGKDFDIHHGEGQAFGVVKELMTVSQLLNKGYHLHTDNFYTKPALAEYLLQHKTMLTGTVRVNSKNLPKDRSVRLAAGESKFWRKGEMLCVSLREKKSQTKPVLVLTTAHNAEVEEREIRDKIKKNPTCIYHKTHTWAELTSAINKSVITPQKGRPAVTGARIRKQAKEERGPGSGVPAAKSAATQPVPRSWSTSQIKD
ncbi:PiggyBac transposable element-derived protein 4-like [Elysia marginata]|uniref:PiggyBac transposable element-derived protein 4-like n=1 Tax=Elysia marginata TaxID=1093978 RepID=A0AAV4GGC7_9GAST|nr:PiggyBac transposable element-derived protein 4-like [Elysia marginata]